MTIIDPDMFFTLEPNLGYGSSEPNLERLIERYYHQSFSAEESKKLAQRYIGALLSLQKTFDPI